jgi:creatinine amidohydrolase
METRWERMTAPELKALAGRNALPILPVGSLEQHGPHLPVWTDSFIGHQMALATAALCHDIPAVVLPPMWLGLSEHHFPFGGTISVDHATFHGILRCVVRSLRAVGFRRLLVLNAHGGNIDPIAVSVRELAQEYAMPILACTWVSAAAAEIKGILTTQSGVQHACEGETSVWLATEPGQVRMDKIADAISNPPPDAPAGLFRFWSFEERAPRTGVRGDPRAATAEKGERIIAAVAEKLAAALHEERLWTTPDEVWRANRAGA